MHSRRRQNIGLRLLPQSSLVPPLPSTRNYARASTPSATMPSYESSSPPPRRFRLSLKLCRLVLQLQLLEQTSPQSLDALAQLINETVVADECLPLSRLQVVPG